MCIYIYVGLGALFPAADLTENSQRYYEIHSVLLPICTVAKAVKAMCKNCSRISGYDSNPCSQPFIITQLNFNFLTWVVFLRYSSNDYTL
jgi:hypothetical protein